MENKSSFFSPELVAGITGGLIFIVFFLALNTGAVISIGAAVAGFLAVYLIFKKNAQSMDVTLSGVSEETLQSTLKQGAENINELRKQSKRIKNKVVIDKINSIIVVLEKIFDDFKKDPKDIKAARQFLSYYLDATIKIVTKYADITEHGAVSSEIASTLEKSEKLLDTIKAAFEKQLGILLRDDVMDLDTEISLLEKTIKMEGLGD